MATILIVEDNDDACKVMIRVCAAIGHRGVGIPNGRAAIAHLKQRTVDLVLLDYMMPELDGVAVLRSIREDSVTANLPVVMYTAVADPSFAQYVLGLGATEFWVKSAMDIAEIEKRIGALLANAA